MAIITWRSLSFNGIGRMKRHKIPLTSVRLFRHPSVLRRSTWVAFHRDQRGASYSLSVVLILPFYIAFVAFSVDDPVPKRPCRLLRDWSPPPHATRVWAPHRKAQRKPRAVPWNRKSSGRSARWFPLHRLATGTQLPNQGSNSALVAAKLPDDAVNRYAIKLGYVRGH